MDRSRGGGANGARPSPEPKVPAASRLTVKSRKNRKKPSSMWSRMPRPRAIADACGRAARRSLPGLAATAKDRIDAFLCSEPVGAEAIAKGAKLRMLATPAYYSFGRACSDNSW